MTNTSVLYVDPDDGPTATEGLADEPDVEVIERETVAGAKETLADLPVDCLVTEYDLPDGTGLELVDRAREHVPDAACSRAGISDEPDFQALLYLAHHRRVRPDEPLEFVFFHFLALLDDAVSRDPDLDAALARVNYHPVPSAEYAGRQEAFDALTEGVAESNNRRKTLERMGHDAYAAFFDRHAFPDTADSDEVLDSEFATRFTDYAITEVGDYKYVDRGADKALKKLCRIRSRNYFADDVDAFESFLDEQCRQSLRGVRRGGDVRSRHARSYGPAREKPPRSGFHDRVVFAVDVPDVDAVGIACTSIVAVGVYDPATDRLVPSVPATTFDALSLLRRVQLRGHR
jgi:CheY-like chemotaxis protein